MANNLYNGINERLFYTLGKRPEIATIHDFYMALSYAVRDQMMTYWLDTQRPPQKEVAYLSAEFLIGPQLNNNCLLYTSPSPRDRQKSRMPSSA